MIYLGRSTAAFRGNVRPSGEPADWVSLVAYHHSMTPADRILVALLTAYVDESGGTSSESKVTCVAAYVFDEDGLATFHQEWAPYLVSKGIPYFHAGKTRRRSDAVEIFETLRNLIERTALVGFVRFAKNTELKLFRAESQLAPLVGDNDCFLTLACMDAVASYAKARGFSVDYFIEHSGNKRLQEYVISFPALPHLKDHFAALQTGFPMKKETTQLQSADLLAWSFHRANASPHEGDGLLSPSPGFPNFREWRAWYQGHNLMGFDRQGLENIASVLVMNERMGRAEIGT